MTSSISKIHLSSAPSGTSPASGHHLNHGVGTARSAFIQRFSDSQIQQPCIEYLNGPPSAQLQYHPPRSGSNEHGTTDLRSTFIAETPEISSSLISIFILQQILVKNSHDRCTTKHIRHQLHRASITGGAGEVTTIGASGRDNQGSATSPSTSQRPSIIADMLTDSGHFGNTLAEHLQLSRTVIAKNSIAKELFRKTSIIDGFTSYKCYDIKEHANSLIELIDFTLQEIHNPTKVVQDRCMIMGAAHCNTSESSMSTSWDQFGDSLAESIAKADLIRGKRKCLKAWNVLLSFIVDRIKGGYLAESKRRASKKSSRQENAGPSSTYMAIATTTTTTTTTTRYDNTTITEPTTYH
uniref:Globin family profile domain-containing protein n=1 Tax=Setaria digitata TaxID=48799 RepID=A0A915Q3A0_9BILA